MTLTLNNSIQKEAQEDILELVDKIDKFKQGKIAEDNFKAFRLARGVYGQRQVGVQMLRLKLPFGKITGEQLIRVADISREYTNGNLHATTRQNFQLHYISLDDSPEIWAKLEEKGVTTKEACGNTVRNITASALAGIDPDEPFDVAPYAEEAFRYFLRNPICQDMGRKIKIAFSSSEKDSAFTYIHDFGFIPRVKFENGKEIRGFKVVVGGGLGAQAFIAETAYEFLPENELIPFLEAAIRVFDRFGERANRLKARLKFLLHDKRSGIGLNGFLELIEKEKKAIAVKTYVIDRGILSKLVIEELKEVPNVEIADEDKYNSWLEHNVFEQKQEGFYAIKIKLPNGNIDSEKAKEFVRVTKGFIADDIRITVSQGLVLRFVRKEYLPYLFYSLNHLELAEIGAGTIADVTACPGTDTCNLAVTNTTTIGATLEALINKEYKHLIKDADINIKISGCMNSCGQHMVANIGFHGSSIRNGKQIIPALQVVLGGGVDIYGKGFIADKVIKLPTKRIPDAVRFLLNDYEDKSKDTEYFNEYYQRQGKIYFYDLLKPLADISQLGEDGYVDWGQSVDFVPEIGVGECAGVSYDVIGSIINDAEERLYYGNKALKLNKNADAIYHAYSSLVIGAKALLLSKDVKCNTHKGIIRDFNEHYYNTGEISLDKDFEALTLQINKNEPTEAFANSYFAEATSFFKKVKVVREQQVESHVSLEDKEVVANFYKA